VPKRHVGDETRRVLRVVCEETIVYLPAEKTSPAFNPCTPAVARRVRCGARLHEAFTGNVVEFHDEQPGCLRGKLSDLFVATFAGGVE
jgi:hypothetical protein